jgi:hypothetical protein
MSVGEVGKKIEGLSNDEIKAVRSYEKNNKNRKTLLEKIEAAAVSPNAAVCAKNPRRVR